MPAIRLLSFAPHLFWTALAAVTILSLIPGAAVPGPLQFWDKAQHALAFALLTVLGCLSYPRHLKVVLLLLLVYGGLIELAQATLTTTRFGDVVDWVADAIGVAAGIAIHAWSIAPLLKTIEARGDLAAMPVDSARLPD